MKRWIGMVIVTAVAGMLWACDEWPEECPSDLADGDQFCDNNQVYECYWHEFHGQLMRTEVRFRTNCDDVGATCNWGQCVVEDEACPPGTAVKDSSEFSNYYCKNNMLFYCFVPYDTSVAESVLYVENCEDRICDVSRHPGCVMR